MEKRRYTFGNLIVFFITLVAVVLWSMAPSVTLQMSTLNELIINLGKLSAIVGTMLFASSLILSARLHIFERIFGGLNKVYVNHSKIGQISLILLLFHPVFLLVKYASSSLESIVVFFQINFDIAKDLGIISLAMMVLLIVVTLYLRIKYNIWKWTHKFLGLAFIFGVFHLILITSDTSRYMPLRIYMIVFCAIAIYSFLYRSVFGKNTILKYKYIISKVNILNETITELVLKTEDKKMEFTAGQFVFINFVDRNISKESHPFSMSSSPDEDTVSITIKNLGDYTSKIKNLNVGSVAYIEGPFGEFSFKNSIFKKQIWIGGGIGITPFLSMAKSLKKEEGYAIDLFYCVNEESEAVYMNQLKELETNGIRVIPFFSKSQGRIDANKINELCGGINGKSIFLCAPPVMINALRNDFINKGVSKRMLHSEEFSF